MKIKTSELIGPALDWAVAKCENVTLWDVPLAEQIAKYSCIQTAGGPYVPSSKWEQGGPIIDREQFGFEPDTGIGWIAIDAKTADYTRGPTHLIAAMRCYVRSNLGDEIEIPDELAP